MTHAPAIEPDDEARFLAAYNIHDFAIPLASVDLAIFSLHSGQLQVLLVRRATHPFKDRWALPGGFVDVDRDASLDATALRKLTEKTGVSTPYLEQVATVGGPRRDPRAWSMTVLYMALIAHTDALPAVDTVEAARWWPWEEAIALDLAFDHRALLLQARERLRSKTAYTALPVFVLPVPFTLSALLQAFEVLLDAPLEKKSFRRRIEETRLLRQVGEGFAQSGRGRPAALFEPDAAARAHVFSRVFGQGGQGK